MGFLSSISEKLNRCSKKNQFVMGKLEEDFEDLFNFVVSGNLEMAQLQLNGYTDVNFKNSSKSTLLISACRSNANEKEIFHFTQFLLNKGAYIMKKDTSGRAAVDYCEQNKLFKVKMLLCKTLDSIIKDNIADFF
ncbi:Hypothetical predicted protein [Mytilus galloprovincialis]|uniref:Uncharacterized protein n=1 Tax=Mytilus galloprovincialis TaxID=29158 RepID=A0A8B6CQT9_MYTGA|nr:Hypothetical predicted protein [Mytilus galloprovincialis]